MYCKKKKKKKKIHLRKFKMAWVILWIGQGYNVCQWTGIAVAGYLKRNSSN
jgi:hypothetical protein